MNISLQIKYLIYFLIFFGGLNFQVTAQSSLQENNFISQSKEHNQKLKENNKLIRSNDSRRISLKEVIEEGLRLNTQENIRKITGEILDLSWATTYDNFYYPTLQIKLNTDSDKLWKIHEVQTPNSENTSIGPDGSLSFGFSKYNVFDWGKSYLTFQNSKDTYKRNKEILDEEKIKLKLNLIKQYFQTAKVKRLETIYRDQINQSHHIYKLAKYKNSLKKASDQEYLAARSEWLRSQSEYYSSYLGLLDESRKLSEILGNKLDISYNIEEELTFIPLVNSLHELKRISRENAPVLKNLALDYKNAVRNHKRVLKELLPLPSFDLYLGSLNQSFSQDSFSGKLSTYNDSSSIELIASINMTWSVWGGDGFLNSRKRKTAEYLKKVASYKFDQEIKKVELSTTNFYLKIKNLENQYIISEYRLENAIRNYDSTLSKYADDKIEFYEIREALTNLRNSYLYLENIKMDHLVLKLELAEYLNIEDFPGENFENLATLNIIKTKKRK